MKMKQKKSVVEAALKELEITGKPLHYKELTRLIARSCVLSGETPHETVRSRLATDKRFKRVAEGMYALSKWKQYPVARFAKDIAFDILTKRRTPMPLTDLGEKIVRERPFMGSPRQIARSAIRNDARFYYDPGADSVGLSECKGDELRY